MTPEANKKGGRALAHFYRLPPALLESKVLHKTYFSIILKALYHDAFIMSLQMPAPTPVQKAWRNRPRQKYSAARAFYLTILVISAIAILSLLKERRTQQHGLIGAKHALFSRTRLSVREDLLHGSSGGLVRRDQAVRWIFFRVTPLKDVYKAHNALRSAVSSLPLKTNARSSAPTVQMRKQVSSPTYNYTIASCTRLDLSPSSYC